MTKFAVFDIDGTLIRWQLYHVIVSKLAHEGALGVTATQTLKDMRMQWKRREHENSFKQYENALIELYENALQNIPESAFDRLVTEVIDEYKDQAYVYTRDLLKQLRSEGYKLLIISGSHHELVEQIGRYYGFDDWLGSLYHRKDGTFSGQKRIVSLEKAKALQELVDKHKLDYTDSVAIGDTKSDVSMLELVQKPIAFNPDRSLFTAAQKNGWTVVIERKNMIYKLESQNGTYVLA